MNLELYLNLNEKKSNLMSKIDVTYVHHHVKQAKKYVYVFTFCLMFSFPPKYVIIFPSQAPKIIKLNNIRRGNPLFKPITTERYIKPMRRLKRTSVLLKLSGPVIKK